MKIGQTYLMSSNELSLIAAASGLNSFLMFDSQVQSDREAQIQSIFHLIADGLLISKDTTITPGPSLIPLLNAFKSASTAVVAKLSSHEAAPICIYYSNSGETFLRIIPHTQKDDIYEVGATALNDLLDDLESLHFLPVLSDWQADDFRQPEGNEASLDRLEDEPYATFKKIDLSTQALIDRASIIQTPSVWAMSSGLKSNIGYTCYSREGFIAWLKGGEL